MVEISIPDVGKFVLYRPPSGLERVRFNADWSARNAPSQVLSIRRRPGEPFKIRYKGEELPAFYADSDAAGVVIAIWAKEGPLPPVAREYDEGEVTGEVLVRAPHADYRDLEEVDPLAEPLHPAGIYVVTKAAALE